jgi:hypothetical protein
MWYYGWHCLGLAGLHFSALPRLPASNADNRSKDCARNYRIVKVAKESHKWGKEGGPLRARPWFKTAQFERKLSASAQMPRLMSTLAPSPLICRMGRKGLPLRFTRLVSRMPPRNKFSPTLLVTAQRSLPASSYRRGASNCSADRISRQLLRATSELTCRDEDVSGM